MYLQQEISLLNHTILSRAARNKSLDEKPPLPIGGKYYSDAALSKGREGHIDLYQVSVKYQPRSHMDIEVESKHCI